MLNRILLSVLAITSLAILAISAPFVLADPVPASRHTLAMMGGGGHGYGGSGIHRGRGGRGGYGDLQDRRRDWGYGRDRYPNRNDSRGTEGFYREDERRELKDELRMERREFSELIRSKNPDPDTVDRKMERIERLENRLDQLR